MLPDDWGKDSLPPETFVLPGQWADVVARYDGLRPSSPLDSVFRLATEHAATTALLERGYIDADYRDEYAHFYASTFRAVPDRCERVHFVSAAGYLGFTSLRPIRMRPVSRTLIAPTSDLAPHISCLAPAVAHVLENELRVDCFPFMGQDAQYGICAHASIWMIAYYHHLVNKTRRLYISDVVEAARVQSIQRLTPSPGLSLEQVGAAFSEIGLPALRYSVKKLEDQGILEQVVCRYLNSRLPVLLALPDHATVLIGYGRESQTQDLFFIRNDDADGPYKRIPDWTNDPSGRWQYLFVPLPGRIYMSGETAEAIGRREIERLLATQASLSPVAARYQSRELRLRTYAIRGSDYKLRMRERGLPDDVASRHGATATSNWIWVTELQGRAAAESGPDCVFGELVIDATSDRFDPHFLFGNFPGIVLSWYGKSVPDAFASGQQVDQLYRTGAALHA